MFKPEIGLSHATGRWILEASTSLNFYSTNDNFFGGSIRKQAPILSVQGHAIYSFQSGVWAALDLTYYNGGRTTVDGVVRNDLQTNWRVLASRSDPGSPHKPKTFHQVLREHWPPNAHRDKIQCIRSCMAIPLGRRRLIRKKSTPLYSPHPAYGSISKSVIV
jgi:hypothetical protein